MSKTLQKYGISVIATTAPSESSNKASMIVEIRNKHTESHQIAIPRSVVPDIRRLKAMLLDAGLDYPKESDWKRIQEGIMKHRGDSALVVLKPGFHGHNYLNPDGRLIGKAEGDIAILSPDSQLLLPNVTTKGELKDWQVNVAVMALHSSRLMLSLCSSFSAYLARWAGIETGGFHLWGKSSIGKSTCLYTATSVYGPRECLNQWSTTNAAIEETAAAYSDLLLSLDELKLLDESASKAAQMATNTIYKLTSGQGKRRSRVYQNANMQNGQRWHTTLLSTGELSLGEHAKGAGPERMLGEEVRVPDVPADAGAGLGIFESLPEGFDSAGQAADALSRNTKNYYGQTHYKFIARLTKDLDKNEELVRKRLSGHIDHFLKHHKVDRSNGHSVRLAKRFALAYAAGYFAIKYKALDFDKEQVFSAISKCYKDTVKTRNPTMQERIDDGYKKVIDTISSLQLLDTRNAASPFKGSVLKKYSGYIVETGGHIVSAIPRPAIKAAVGDDKAFKPVIDRLINEGRILTDAQGKSTRPIASLSRGSKTKRYICFIGTPDFLLE